MSLTIRDIMERMKRGGLCFVGSKRHVVANNKYMEKYDDTQESNYLATNIPIMLNIFYPINKILGVKFFKLEN